MTLTAAIALLMLVPLVAAILAEAARCWTYHLGRTCVLAALAATFAIAPALFP